jgi:hypothetical protein
MKQRCPHCGADLPDTGDAFCSECREPVDAILENRIPASNATEGVLPAATSPHRMFGDHTKFFLICLYGITLAASASEIFSIHPAKRTFLNLLLGIASMVACGNWITVDAERQGRPIRDSLRSLCYIFGLFAVCIYTVWSRGWRGAAFIILHAFGLVAFAAALMLIFSGID